MRAAFICLFCASVLMISCNKKTEDCAGEESYSGSLPITSALTPTTVTRGQDIVSTVRLELFSLSGTVSFTGFDVEQSTSRQFGIKATAYYKDWNLCIAAPVMWTMDTTVALKTTDSGIYVLNFYNSTELIESDTVKVN